MVSEGTNGSDPGFAPAATPVPPPASPSPPWPDELRATAALFYAWLSRPRVRLTVTGVILLLIGGLLTTNSVWTLPLVIAGALMVMVAWIGGRLDGRLAVQWGAAGTQLEFRTQIKAAQPTRAAATLTSSSPHTTTRTPEPEPTDAEIIEGEAHTVEIDVAELRALIAAVQTTEAAMAHAQASGQATRNLRVAYGGDPQARR